MSVDFFLLAWFSLHNVNIAADETEWATVEVSASGPYDIRMLKPENSMTNARFGLPGRLQNAILSRNRASVCVSIYQKISHYTALSWKLAQKKEAEKEK